MIKTIPPDLPPTPRERLARAVLAQALADYSFGYRFSSRSEEYGIHTFGDPDRFLFDADPGYQRLRRLWLSMAGDGLQEPDRATVDAVMEGRKRLRCGDITGDVMTRPYDEEA